MTDYNQDYFFIRSDNVNNTRLPSLVPDTNTGERRFHYEPEPTGSAPLIFSNGWKEEFRRRGVRDDLTDILFDGNNFMVRERLLQYEIPNLHIHPAIYIDDRDEWHEDYWYLTFSELLTAGIETRRTMMTTRLWRAARYASVEYSQRRG